ncbi:hypothetical protein [Streptomyces sp. MMBL 11-1]|uniref:hypothetical protein n=1 Tax=Streptomyces sp. MMBL 11-1 TaxID=3026420 RepID=UPI002361ABCD|nr:hypothetical protein [Streptomyces sp. MMBL 11-1]
MNPPGAGSGCSRRAPPDEGTIVTSGALPPTRFLCQGSVGFRVTVREKFSETGPFLLVVSALSRSIFGFSLAA